MKARPILLGGALAGLAAAAAVAAWLARGGAAEAHLEQVAAEAAGRLPAAVLWYREREAGVDPYTTRIIVTERWLRMDDGAAGTDYVLLDRKARVVYSVAHETRSVLVIPYREVEARPPVPLEYGLEREVQEEAPRIAGREVVHYTYRVNGERCRDAMVVPGLLPEAVAAMRELARVMAGEHGANLANTPVEVQREMLCDLAESIFAPERYLEHGLPIQEWEAGGYHRALVDFDPAWEADPKLFTLPEGYRRFTVSEVTGGA